MPKELQSLLPIVLMFVIFYFLLIRPQQKRQKEHQQLVNNLQVNDSVVTAGGIRGTIVKVKDDAVVLKAIDSTKFEVMKSHVSYVDKSASDDDKDDK